MESQALVLSVLSVNIGRPALLGHVNGEPVMSGFRKSPAAGATLRLGETNLEGDGQADLSVHGGPDKAVYAYPARHWPAWQAEHGLVAGPGVFGENITFEGGDESGIRIGDVFAWGEARIQVSQPRQPCFKLALFLGRTDIGPAMIRSARSGFYLRVLRAAPVPLGSAQLTRIETRDDAPSVRGLFQALYDTRRDAASLRALAATPALAEAWQEAFLKRAEARSNA